ncbi:uncharacterized protein LOC131885674 isoform X2 [Tigriopus californicus]|uniref:uncharacterized protein LOC131885674 isoform X2 n=1 Tax=Tigriopus californicus TaxID=6832 RepID=UPI0027DA6A83|nr:uncharacterized protein LOC131885674 isoform X2 [Tigriopus californicus]
MRPQVTTLLFVLVFISRKSSTATQNGTRAGKLFSIFQIINFPNEGCIGSSSRNGTCYTSDECASKGGSSAGTCAQGFGVCCIFTLSCGGSTSENCTYLVEASSSNPTSDPCTFTICKCSSNICRIRLDFTTFSIAGPVVGTTDGIITANGGAIGDCTTDSFSVTSPGNYGSPLICGFNTGQHMILDASDLCHRAHFDFSGTSISRQFDIKVTQYACGDEGGGPDGCLQYFTGNTGTFASFNFPTSGTTISSTVTHLSNQCYTMCFRQEEGKCAICYNTVIPGDPGMAIDQGSFGLSTSPDGGIAIGTQDTGCSTDYLQIPGAERNNDPATYILGWLIPNPVRLPDGGCDLIFVVAQQTPFRVIFKTDSNEEVVGDGTDAMTDEQPVGPGGIIGFFLNYALLDC